MEMIVGPSVVTDIPAFLVIIFCYSLTSIVVCTGSYVAPGRVLTAAHCTASCPAGIWVGANYTHVHPLLSLFPEPNVFHTEVHPKFHPNNFTYDFSVLSVSGLDDGGARATLSAAASVLETPGSEMTIAGYGTTASDEQMLSDVPRKARVQILDPGEFEGVMPIDRESMMVAGDLERRIDTCHGDSGGPMYEEETGVLVGVTSWGYGCGDPHFPGVYARVSAGLPWILSQAETPHNSP